MKSGPVYLNDYSIEGTLRKVAAQPEAGITSPDQLRRAFDRYANVSYLKYVTGADVKIKANPKGGRLMEVKYEVRLPMIYNVEAIYKFEHQVALPSP